MKPQYEEARCMPEREPDKQLEISFNKRNEVNPYNTGQALLPEDMNRHSLARIKKKKNSHLALKHVQEELRRCESQLDRYKQKGRPSPQPSREPLSLPLPQPLTSQTLIPPKSPQLQFSALTSQQLAPPSSGALELQAPPLLSYARSPPLLDSQPVKDSVIQELNIATSEPVQLTDINLNEMDSEEHSPTRPRTSALAELKKLWGLSKIKDTPNDICSFACHVRHSVAAIMKLGKTEFLGSLESTISLMEKMPATMKSRWVAYRHSRREEMERSLVLLYDFMGIEIEMWSDFATVAVSCNNAQEIKKRCPECNEEHWIYKCKIFEEATVDKRWELVKKANLCSKCLRCQHSLLVCKAPRCNCKEEHHTSLHFEELSTT